MTSRRRFASTAVTAPLVWHYMADFATGHSGHGWRALCGERRRSWEPVESFAVPEAFDACPTCERLAGTSA